MKDLLRCSLCGGPIGLLDLNLDDKHDFCARVESQREAAIVLGQLRAENKRLSVTQPRPVAVRSVATVLVSGH